MADPKNVYTVKINIEGVEAEAQRAGNSLDKNIGKAANKVKKDLNLNLKMTSKISDTIKANFMTIAGAVGIQGIAQSFSQGVKSLAAFNLKMAETSTLLAGNERISKDVVDAVTDLSSQFGKDKADLAAAYYDIVSAATSDAKDSIDLLTASTKLAVVGVSDVETATGTILSVLNAYKNTNISAAEAADQLFSIVQAGRTNMRLLGSSIGDVIPIAAQLNIPLAELGGFLAVATRVSGNTAKTTTALNAALTSVLKPADSVRELVKRLNEELGANIQFSATALSDQGLVGFLKNIIDATSGLQNQQEVLAQLFGSQRAVKAIMSVLGPNFLEFKKAVDQVNNSVGVLDEGMLKINDTLSQKFNVTVEKIKNTFGGLVDILTPVLGGVLDVVGSLADATDDFFFKFQNAFGLNDDGSAQENLVTLPEKIKPVADAINNVASAAGNAGKKLFDLNAEAAKTPTQFDPALEASRNFHAQMVNMEVSFERIQKQAFAQGMSRGIQALVSNLGKGSEGFKNFARASLGIIGDMAIMIGNFMITTSGAIKAMISNIFTAPGAMLAGGIALIALGSLIKGFAGSGGAASTGGGSTAGIPVQTTDVLDDTTTIAEDEGPEAIERQQMVQVVVNGSIFDSDETATRILNILDTNFENKGGRVAYA